MVAWICSKPIKRAHKRFKCEFNTDIRVGHLKRLKWLFGKCGDHFLVASKMIVKIILRKLLRYRKRGAIVTSLTQTAQRKQGE